MAVAFTASICSLERIVSGIVGPTQSADRPAEVNSRWYHLAVLLLGLGLILLVVFTVGPSLGNHLVSDDWVFLYEVSEARTFGDALNLLSFSRMSWWFVRPMQLLSTWLLYNAAGTNAVAYHLASVVLDWTNALLLGILSFQLLSRSARNPRVNVIASLFVSALFVFNWRHHEVVFWYSAISELLGALFRFGALLLVLYSLQAAKHRYRRWCAYLLAVVAYGLALLSKESSFILPVELLLLLVFFYVTGQRHDRRELVRFLLMLVPFFLVLGFWALNYTATSGDRTTAVVARGGFTFISHAGFREWVLRFIQFFNGNFIGPGQLVNSIPRMTLEIIGICAIAVVALIRRRYVWLFALLWTLVGLAPYAAMTGIEVVRQRIPILSLGIDADRYLYYSSAAAALLLVTSVLWFLEEVSNLAGRTWVRWFAVLIGVGIGLILVLNISRLVRLESEWRTAGEIGDRILVQIVGQVPDPKPNSLMCLDSLPDSYRGKYIFRQGIEGALRLAYSRNDFQIRKTIRLPGPMTQPAPLDVSGCSYILRYDESLGSMKGSGSQ